LIVTMPRRGLFFFTLFACFLLQAPAMLRAQAHPSVESGVDQVLDLDSGTNGTVPETKGYNLSLNTTSQHDSSNGWSSLMTPDFAYRFNKYFSADASIPIYIYIVPYVQTGTAAKPVYKYEEENHAPGDAEINFRFETHHDFLDYLFTATMGLPSGNRDYGLGAGQVTYALNDHFERSFGIFTPDIELGIGDSSSLVSTVAKPYVAVGTLANFQAGTGVELPFHASFDAEAYEELPLTKTIIYSTTGKGKKKVTTATNEGAAEDNGFTTELDIPLNRHTVISGFYNRSRRNKIDTAGFGFTFLLKPAPLPRTEEK
jgi:hypothetical protein